MTWPNAPKNLEMIAPENGGRGDIPIDPVASRPSRYGTSIRLIAHSAAQIAPKNRALVRHENTALNVAYQQSHLVVGDGDVAATRKRVIWRVVGSKIFLDQFRSAAIGTHHHASRKSRCRPVGGNLLRCGEIWEPQSHYTCCSGQYWARDRQYPSFCKNLDANYAPVNQIHPKMRRLPSRAQILRDLAYNFFCIQSVIQRNMLTIVRIIRDRSR